MHPVGGLKLSHLDALPRPETHSRVIQYFVTWSFSSMKKTIIPEMIKPTTKHTHIICIWWRR